MESRYQLRAWKTQQNTVEAAIVDTKNGQPRSRYVQNDDLYETVHGGRSFEQEVTGLERGFWLRVDPECNDALIGGSGVNLYYVESIGDEFVRYMSLLGWDRQDMWRETTDKVSTFEYMLRNDELIPLEQVGHPSQAVLPTGEQERIRA